MCKWSWSSLKGWGKINISWDNTSLQQRVHTILDVRFSDRWRISKWVIPEILRQNSLWLEYFIGAPWADTKFLKLDIRNATLRSAIFKWVRLRKRVFFPESPMPSNIFWIHGELTIFLLSHLNSSVSTLLHDYVSWSWFWAHSSTHRSYGFISSPYACLWYPNSFVAKTDIRVEIVFNFVHMILELSQRSWNSFPYS